MFAVYLSLVTLAGCSTSTGPTGSDIMFPDTNIRFSASVQPFLITSCGFSGCHGDNNAAGGIRLTNYSSLFFDRPNLIVPGAPNESVLIQTLEGKIAHSIGGLEYVTSNQIQGMRRWVLEGALNN